MQQIHLSTLDEQVLFKYNHNITFLVMVAWYSNEFFENHYPEVNYPSLFPFVNLDHVIYNMMKCHDL